MSMQPSPDTTRLDALTRRHLGPQTFKHAVEAILATLPRYRPTIHCTSHSKSPRVLEVLAERTELADALDAEFERRGSDKRVWRGPEPLPPGYHGEPTRAA